MRTYWQTTRDNESHECRTCQPTVFWPAALMIPGLCSTGSYHLPNTVLVCAGASEASGAAGRSPSRQCRFHTAAVADIDRLTRKGVMTEEVLQKLYSFKHNPQVVRVKQPFMFWTYTFRTLIQLAYAWQLPESDRS